MAQHVNDMQSELEPEPVVKYFPDTQWLWIDSGNPLGEGETIANGVVVFYGKGDDAQAEGVRIEFAEDVLKPFVDVILAKDEAKKQAQSDDRGKTNEAEALPHDLRTGYEKAAKIRSQQSGEPNVANRTIFIRDNLEVMRGINSAAVDLIYLDPPFNSKRMFEAPIGSQAAGASFKDAWTLDDVKEEWVTQIEDEHPALAHIITAAGKAHSEGMQAYLTWMTVRLMEMQRLLKRTGSIYLHCDPTASHYLKAAMDAVFGAENFRSEITWKRTTTHSDTKNWAAVNDIIFYYANSATYLWNPQYGEYDQQYISTKYRYDDNDGRGRYRLDNMTSPNPRPNMMYEWRGHTSPPKGWRYSQERMAELDSEGRIWYPDSKQRRPQLKRYLNEMPGRIQDTIWTDIAPVNSQAKERTGYPTQKPLALLERIIKASSNEGDLILDPFCGCATACIAAERLGRQWIGIDISEKAYELVIDRMRREVSLGDEDLPALFGTVVHRTDVPKRTDADAPRRSPNIKDLLYAIQSGACAGCEIALPTRLLELDHIIPRSKGGADVDSNLQLLCGWCNRTKGARSNEYLRERLEQVA